MAKRPPMNLELNVCQNLEWREHFKPQKRGEPSLRDVHSYPDLSTVIYLCMDSYNDQPDPKTIPNPYKRLWSVSTNSSNGGYFGAIYVNESAKQVVLAHRGTDSKAAVKADIAILACNRISKQILSAMTCTHELKNKMEKRFPKWKLIITGHSLGSYLTDVSIFSHMYLESGECGITFHKRKNNEISSSVTFLPYGVGIDGPGSFEIISKLRDMTDVRYGNGKPMRVEDLPVDHYVRAVNFVNCQYKQVGGLFQIQPGESKINSMMRRIWNKCTGGYSTHKLDNFISEFTGKDLPQMKQIIDFPKNLLEFASVDSRTPRIDGDYAVGRFQVIDVSKETTELRFFSSHVQKLLYDFNNVKRYARKWTSLLDLVLADDRKVIDSILSSLTMDERNATVVCSAYGMNKQKLIPWITEFFDAYPNFIDKDNVICSIFKNVFQYSTWLQFRRDPLNMKLDSKLPHIVGAKNTTIAASEVVASLGYLDKKYVLLKASQIKILEENFKFGGDILLYAVVIIDVFDEDNQHVIHDFIRKFDSSKVIIIIHAEDAHDFIRKFDSDKIIIIKHAEDAPVGRCKVDDLTDECKEDLLSTELRLHGKTVKLHDFVTFAKISDALVHSSLSGELGNIPESIGNYLLNAYVDIERRLVELKDKPRQYTPKFTIREAMKFSKILIIADLPGSGKTTMVTRLSAQLNEWVIKVKLNEKSSVLEEWHKAERNISNSTTEDLLSELAGIDPSIRPLLKSVIEDWKSVVKICVIFDAFDEVGADYEDLVIEFLRKLRQERKISNIIVTTRPHLKRKLEQFLKTESCSLGQLSFDELVRLHSQSLQFESCPLSQYSFDELVNLHHQGRLEKLLQTGLGASNRSFDDALINFLNQGETETFVETELIRFLHDELIGLHIKRHLGRPFNWNSLPRNELTKLHRDGKIEKSLQTEWCPKITFSTEHKEMIDLHLNSEADVKSRDAYLLEKFLHDKVIKHFRNIMEKILQNESCSSRRLTCTQLIENCDMLKQSLDAKLSFLIDFSYEELVKQHIEDTLNPAVRTKSYCLATFTDEEGIEFMTKIIAKPNYSCGRVRSLFINFALKIDTSVIQTPMMLQLIANKMEEKDKHDELCLSIHSLYSDHIKQVFQQYVKVKAMTQNERIAKVMQETLFSSNLNFIYYFAIKEVLHMTDDEINFYGLKQPCNTDREMILGHGLLVESDSSFRLKHRTFSEFFVSKWLMSDTLKPQVCKLFVDIISTNRIADSHILEFLDGEAGERSMVSDGEEKRRFFEQVAHYYCTHNSSKIISTKRRNLTRYIFNGIKKFCDETTLQNVLLKGSGREMLFGTRRKDDFEFLMAMYHEAGLISLILKSNVKEIIQSVGRDEQCFFAILKLVEEYLDYDEVMQIVRGCNGYIIRRRELKFLSNVHIQFFKWQINFLTTLNREDELGELILDKNHQEENPSLYAYYPEIVHHILKEMNSPVLNGLPKVFDNNYGHSSVWKSVTSFNNFNFQSMRYVCLKMFPDQYGDNVANEYRMQFLNHKCGMLTSFLDNVPHNQYRYVAPLMLEMAIASGLSTNDEKTVLDVIFRCTPDADSLQNLLYEFAALGSAVAVKKLLGGVLIKNAICATVNVNKRDHNGEAALQIAEKNGGDKHRLVVAVINEHIRRRNN